MIGMGLMELALVIFGVGGILAVIAVLVKSNQ